MRFIGILAHSHDGQQSAVSDATELIPGGALVAAGVDGLDILDVQAARAGRDAMFSRLEHRLTVLAPFHL